jgi:branched-chain amino acid transport system ATP-binding protein
MLEIKGLETSYGLSKVLFGIDMTINDGEVVTLMGRNGMGKSTTVKSIMGIVRPQGGSITFEGRQISGWTSFNIARAGIGLVPEGRHIFPNLTVRENLVATARLPNHKVAPWVFERVVELFPRLKERLTNYGNQLSGGEQQMLAIGRALMINPKLLILDEATEGLAPLIQLEIWRCLERLRESGQAILVIDKNIKHLTALANRHYILSRGRIVWHGTSDDLRADETVLDRFLSV